LTLFTSLNHYWSTPSHLALFASALDPRFKHLKFISDRQRNEVLVSLKNQYSLLKQQEDEQINNQTHLTNLRSVNLPLRTNPDRQKNIFDNLFDDLQQFEQEQDEFENIFLVYH